MFSKGKNTIPIPALLHADFSRSLIDRDYLLTACLSGKPWNKLKRKARKQHIDVIQREIGLYLGQLHQIEGPGFGYFSNLDLPESQTWGDAFIKMVFQAIDDGVKKQVRFPLPAKHIAELFLANRYCLQDVVSPRLIHFDIWGGNIFVNKIGGGYKVEGIIDWERAFWGDPYADFVSNFDLFEAVERAPAFLEGYADSSGSPLIFNEHTRQRLKL